LLKIQKNKQGAFINYKHDVVCAPRGSTKINGTAGTGPTERNS